MKHDDLPRQARDTRRKNLNKRETFLLGHDRTSIALPANQYKLASDLAKNSAQTPLLCVLIHGGSIKLGSLLDDCTAIVDAWYVATLPCEPDLT